MKPCKTYEQDLLLLAHGQLNANDATRMRQHLAACTPCGERLTQLSSVSLLLADAVYFVPIAPVVASPPRSSFLPARQQWLLSAFLGGCILFALLSVFRTAQSYAAPMPGMARILPFVSASAPLACPTTPPCDVVDGARSTSSPKNNNGVKTYTPTTVAPATNY